MTHLWLKYELGDDNPAETAVVKYELLAVSVV